jgi:uncharacterized protein YcnI
MIFRAVIASSLTVVVLAWATPAWAHVTIDPSSLPQGIGDAVLTFRVPNESTTATVVGLKVQFPLSHPIAVVNPEAGTGWLVTVQRSALHPPIRTDDGTFTTTVSEIDWKGGSIPVGQFGTFEVLAQGLPRGVSQLAFPTIQVYSDGSSVDWIQTPNKAIPDPPHPAPVLQLTTAESPSTTIAGETNSGSSLAATTTSGTGGSNALSVVALILSGFGVVIALLAIWLGRPLRTATTASNGRPDEGDLSS